jgi:glycosyltransferase involved in cell wall biosynthesis
VRILFLDARTEWTGQAHAFLAAGRALAARGYDVTFACPAESALAAAAGGASLPHVEVGTTRNALARTPALRRALLEHFIDVVFVHGELDDLAASLAVRSSGRGSVVRRCSAGERPVVGWRTRLARRLAPVTYLLTSTDPGDVRPANGASMVGGELGLDLPPATRDEALAPASRATPRLACIGTRDARHGVQNVLRAVALLAERHPRVQLTLGGSAARLEELRLHAAALNIARHVQFLPGSTESEVLRSAELAWVIARGDDEAFGCLNVMARSLPVLTERTAISEHFVEHGVHGALFPSLEPPAMAAAVAVFAARPEQRQRMGLAARLRVEREFNEREMANGFEQATRAAREFAHTAV